MAKKEVKKPHTFNTLQEYLQHYKSPENKKGKMKSKYYQMGVDLAKHASEQVLAKTSKM